MTQQYGIPTFDEIDQAMEANVPMAWGLQTVKKFRIVTEPDRSGLWLYLEVALPCECPKSSAKAIKVEMRSPGGKPVLAVGTDQRPLHHTIYSFLGGLVHRVETAGEDLNTAIESEIAAWIELLRQERYLGLQQQIGLLGELWLLWRMVQAQGPQGMDAWLGPVGEQHDFRLAGIDVEVKTTTEPSRSHVVSSLQQLSVKPGAQLAVFSVQLQPAGQADGITLPQACERLRTFLATDPPRQNRFVQYLDQLGFAFDDGPYYKTAFSLRTLPTLIPVDESFPRILPSDIQTALGSERSMRILSASYRINVEGLGYDVHDERFTKLLPLPAEGDLYA